MNTLFCHPLYNYFVQCTLCSKTSFVKRYFIAKTENKLTHTHTHTHKHSSFNMNLSNSTAGGGGGVGDGVANFLSPTDYANAIG